MEGGQAMGKWNVILVLGMFGLLVLMWALATDRFPDEINIGNFSVRNSN